MLRGGARNITLPPLHGVGDVIGLLLFLVVLFCLASWLWGGSPLQVLGNLLNPPAEATLVELQVALMGLPDDVSVDLLAHLPAREKASPSMALDIAQRTAEELVAQRDHWRLGALRSARIKEALGGAAWEAGYQQAEERQTMPDSATGVVATVLVLVAGRSLRLPKHVDGEALAHVLLGLALLDPRHLAAYAVVCSPLGAPSDQRPAFSKLVAI